MSGTDARLTSATADIWHLAFTSLQRSNCETISPAVSTSKICAASTCFIVDSCRIPGGTRYAGQAIVSFPMNLRGSRRRMPQARSSWIAPPISCSWRAAGEPLRLPPVSLCRLSTGDVCLEPVFVANRSVSNSRSGEASSQAGDRGGRTAHLHDPARDVVLLGEHARVLIHIADQPLFRIRQHHLVLHHRRFKERDNRLAQRGHVLG